MYVRYGARVRKPTFPEQLYIDFDGFFAACEEQADCRLQGRPLGVIPFAGAVHSCVIAANTMAKRAGVTTGMAIADARRRCPGIALVPQQPDLYTRVHHRIVAAVLDVLPIDAVCSIDEFAATVAPHDIPAALTHQIKQRLRDAVGECVTCSIGYAPNRWLAKIATDLDKPDGLTVLHPRELPGRLLTLDLEDVPGVATRMRTRLARSGLTSVEDLWQADPLQLRAAWGQRDRRAALVRAPWLRGGTAADTASVHRPRPGPAPGAAAGIGRPDLGAAAGREGGPADAAGRISRPAAHAVGRLFRRAALEGGGGGRHRE